MKMFFHIVFLVLFLTGCSTLVLDEGCHLDLERVRNDSVGKFRLSEVVVKTELLYQGREVKREDVESTDYKRIEGCLRCLEEVVKRDLTTYAANGDLAVNLDLTIKKHWQRTEGNPVMGLLDTLGILSLGILPCRIECRRFELLGHISGDGVNKGFTDEFTCTTHWTTWTPLAWLWGLSDDCLGMCASMEEKQHDLALNRELGHYISEVVWAHLRTIMAEKVCPKE